MLQLSYVILLLHNPGLLYFSNRFPLLMHMCICFRFSLWHVYVYQHPAPVTAARAGIGQNIASPTWFKTFLFLYDYICWHHSQISSVDYSPIHSSRLRGSRLSNMCRSWSSANIQVDAAIHGPNLLIPSYLHLHKHLHLTYKEELSVTPSRTVEGERMGAQTGVL